MKTLNPEEFWEQNNMREIDNCVNCSHASNYDYCRYIVCNHPNREEPKKIKDCSEYICDKHFKNK